MNQQLGTMSSPRRAMKPAHYVVFAGAAFSVVALGSFLGFFTASATSSQAPDPIPSRSLPLVPAGAGTPSGPVVANASTPLNPLPMPGEQAKAAEAPSPDAAEPSTAAPSGSLAAAAPAASAKGKKGGRKDHFIELPSAPNGQREELSESSVRRSLEGRMQSGKANANDLKMLETICAHQGDSVCRGQAQEALRKLSGEGERPSSAAPSSSG